MPSRRLDTGGGMHAGQWAQVMVLMLLPTLLVAFALHLGPGVRAVRRHMMRRTGDAEWQPTGPPIERLAADLRRLLGRYELIMRSTDLPMRARRLQAVEGAIADCAIEAASALGLNCPGDEPPRRLSTAQLRSLLQRITDEGLALPPAIGLLAGSSD